MMKLTSTREQRGKIIAQHEGQVKRIDDFLYVVKSQSNNGEYTVNKVDGEWICACPDNAYRHVACKHIHAVNFSQSLRAEVKAKVISPITNTITECIYCGSTDLRKDGVRKNKTGTIQIFECKDCHKYMTFNLGFEHMKHNPQAITTAMQLYFSGESLRNTVEALKLLGIEVSHQTIYNWIKKYIGLMQNYLKNMKPNVSETWRADELYVKINGNMKYLFAMMDDETRFWIAQEVGQTKDKHDARQLFNHAKILMGKQPTELITDGLPSYSVASKEIFPETNHVREITLSGAIHNNKMERMNGEVRDREKTMRGLKIDDTAILQGYQLYHNYIRPHMALDGKTPSEVCGIMIEGENKWKTLIQNASKEKKAELKRLRPRGLSVHELRRNKWKTLTQNASEANKKKE
ncbi:MAG TPA: IS6 family transposase [Candidatus Limnocylindrales bacterium]|nr:IS6 family transposase [Candidatus Limnocylindrales bacterium]